MHFLHDAAWVLLGVCLGLTGCVVLTDQTTWVTTFDVVPAVRLAVFGMLIASVSHSPFTPRSPARSSDVLSAHSLA